MLEMGRQASLRYEGEDRHAWVVVKRRKEFLGRGEEEEGILGSWWGGGRHVWGVMEKVIACLGVMMVGGRHAWDVGWGWRLACEGDQALNMMEEEGMPAYGLLGRGFHSLVVQYKWTGILEMG
jgi:hypothetical protein